MKRLSASSALLVNMSHLTISVAMCTFNGNRFLGAQLESVAMQDRPPDELVVCDDGSTDGSCEIAKEFARRAPFTTRIVVNEQNLGSTKNFEKVISLCQGEIIVLADQDDVWYRHKLQRLEEAFLRSSAIVAAFSDADLIDGDSRPLKLRLWPTFSFDLAKQNQFANGQALKVLINGPVVTGAAMAFRRECFGPIAPIPASQIHDRWISFLLTAWGEFEVIADPLMQYRRHQSQQVGTGAITLREKTNLIGARGASHFLDEINRFQQLYDRLGQHKALFPYAEEVQKEIQTKMSHLAHRAGLHRIRIARLPKVIGEVLNGHYNRYSGGWRSVARDLTIR
jgi:glycosyltransferase involved in cell wall biosynthesis